jgi:hypothetical protein
MAATPTAGRRRQIRADQHAGWLAPGWLGRAGLARRPARDRLCPRQ